MAQEGANGLSLQQLLQIPVHLPIHVLQIFSFLLPEDFQYFGIWLLSCLFLNAFYATKIFKLFKICKICKICKKRNQKTKNNNKKKKAKIKKKI